MKEIKPGTRCLFNHISGRQDEYFWKDMPVVVVERRNANEEYPYLVRRINGRDDPFSSYASELTPIKSCIMP